jgi:hypothetical protein
MIRPGAWAAALLLALLLRPVEAAAGACSDSSIPDCQEQVQAPIGYSGWQTSGWAYYCTGDHPYYWGLGYNYAVNFSFDNTCFSVIENIFAEGTPNKFDATLTNWCLDDQSITVTLGCSAQPPPGFGPACNYVGNPVSDPGCPTSNIANHCSSTNPAVCFQTSTETCSNGTTYSCTTDLLVTWCYQCAG